MKNYEHDFYKQIANSSLPDKQLVREDILYDNHKGKSSKHKAIVTIAACLTAIIAISLSVEPVRATILSWFRENSSIENYVAQPENERNYTAELEQIIEDTQLESENAPSIELYDIDPEWQEWVYDLQLTVGEPYYDGSELIVPMNAKSGAMELAMADTMKRSDESYVYPYGVDFENVRYVTLDDKTYNALSFTNTTDSVFEEIVMKYNEDSSNFNENWVLTPEAAENINSEEIDLTTTFVAIGGEVEVPENYDKVDFSSMQEDERLAYIKEHPIGKISDEEYYRGFEVAEGDHELVATCKIVLTDYTTATIESRDEYGLTTNYDRKTIGYMRLTVPFHADTPKKDVREINEAVQFVGEAMIGTSYSDNDYVYYENKLIDLTPITMTVDKVEIKPTQMLITVSYDFEDGFEYKDSFMYYNNPIFSSSEYAFRSSSEYPVEGAEYEQVFVFDILESEAMAIKNITLTPTVGYSMSFDNVEIEEDGVTAIPLNLDTGGKVQYVELKDCSLTFDMQK